MPANCACSSNCALHYRTYTTGQSATNMVHASFLPSRRVRLLLGSQQPIHHRRSQEVPLKAREMDRNVRILKRDVYLNRCPRLSMLSGCPKLSGSYSRVLAHLFLQFNHFPQFKHCTDTDMQTCSNEQPQKMKGGAIQCAQTYFCLSCSRRKRSFSACSLCCLR